ncbi:MAG: hypothetical protein JST22_21350 [Bacteroidetes bacterium]|nr:hypothetical protein [Bacteroidota bacterium]
MLAITDMGLYRSTDDGASWARRMTGERGVDSAYAYTGSDAYLSVTQSGRVVIPILTHVTGSSKALSLTRLYSDDGGDHWNRLETPLGIVSGVDCVLSTQDGIMYIGGDGIFRSDDEGEHVRQLNASFPGSIENIAMIDEHGRVFARDPSGPVNSTDHGITWQRSVPPVDGIIAVGPGGEALSVQSATNGGNKLLRSTDYGDHWDGDSLTLWPGTKSAITFTHNDAIIVGTSDSGVFRSSDHGATWKRSKFGGEWIQTVSVAPSGTIFLASSSGDSRFPKPSTYRSTDDGLTWEPVGDSNNLYGFGVSPRGVLYERHLHNAEFALFRPTDQGETFVLLDHPYLGDLADRDIGFNAAGDVFIPTGHGLFRSRDDGDSWTEEDDGIPLPDVHSLACDPEGYLYAIANRRLYRTVEPTMGVSESHAPAAASDVSIRPNPSSGVVTIALHLSTPARVVLEAYDAAGEHVASIADGELTEGNHALAWDTGALRCGAYLLRLRANGDISTARMVVLR